MAEANLPQIPTMLEAGAFTENGRNCKIVKSALPPIAGLRHMVWQAGDDQAGKAGQEEELLVGDPANRG